MGTVQEVHELQALHPPLTKTDDREALEQQSTEYHLTGFGTFHNVPVNPTQLVAESLTGHLARRPLPPTANLASTRVLKVSAATTRRELDKMYGSIAMQGQRVVVLHLGVNAAAGAFQLEIQGKNEATFSCADEMGYRPVKEPIDASRPLTAPLGTSLDVERLVGAMGQRGYDVEVSTDAGRFVCNWVYYHSLRLAERHGAQALFVHVPPANIVGIKEQTAFVRDLMVEIAREVDT